MKNMKRSVHVPLRDLVENPGASEFHNDSEAENTTSSLEVSHITESPAAVNVDGAGDNDEPAVESRGIPTDNTTTGCKVIHGWHDFSKHDTHSDDNQFLLEVFDSEQTIMSVCVFH